MPFKDNTQEYDEARALLISNQFQISVKTVPRCHTTLDWTFCGSAYCQIIREGNKVKCLECTCSHLHDDFTKVVYRQTSVFGATEDV